MITESQPVPAFGRDGEPCPACGAPLAGDQRYCLHCGTRRPEARLEFLDVLDADVRVRAAAPVLAPPLGFGGGVTGAGGAGAPGRGLNARLQANSGVLALGALLLLTLLIGLLVGHWATGLNAAPQAASTPTPQVIRVEGGAAAPATAAAPGTTGGGASSSGSSKAAKSSLKSGASSTKATAPKDAVSVQSLSSKKAVDDAVKKGKPITTGGGKLPPKDGKAPGGGSAIEEIG
ncbi:MAG TPA: zinc ribbon domain-containing protein [Baekduia sp.]|nr:zinc ribbon domain-containing protein [Baekduia sp.]